jgi:undecaprenyl diphosphate synthase
VNGIFKLIVKYVNSELEELDKNNVHINIFGEYDMLPKASVDAINRMVGRLDANDGLVFNIALNYGGRDEILKSVRSLVSECAREGRDPSDLTEDDISRYLYSGSAHFDVPDPDLIIRTSGEERMSNFLTWQAAYSELMFTDTLWPDFTPEEYAEMIDAYANRDRRFGGRKSE